MAVNQLLSKIADGLMPRGSPVAAKTDDTEATEAGVKGVQSEEGSASSVMVMMLKDALEPPVTRLKQLRDAVESGLSNVSTQLVELQTLTAVQKTQNEKVAEGLGKVEGATSKMLTTHKEMQEALSTLKTTPSASGRRWRRLRWLCGRRRRRLQKTSLRSRAKQVSSTKPVTGGCVDFRKEWITRPMRWTPPPPRLLP